jgi:tetratricopeptide (TPR) repeat protein
LIAAAVPHWCDHAFLAALLETTPEEGDRLLGHLCTLTVVEPFPARGARAVNVHETARHALREQLRKTDPARWKALSIRARAHVANGTESHARIEALYHLFAIDQIAAAAACQALDREFADSGRPEVRHALAIALRELSYGGWLQGAAQVEALLCPLQVRSWRGEAAQLESEARAVVELARGASHTSGVCRGLEILSDALEAKGRLDESLAVSRECLAISQRMASADPSNAVWQREVAGAHRRIGDIAEEQERLDDALGAFAEYLAILQRLASTDPFHAGWQIALGVAYNRVGGIAQAQGRLDDALTAFAAYLDISQRLASTNPSHADWQRELGVAYNNIGAVAEAQGRFDRALAAFRNALAVAQRLAEIDPSNVSWQRDLATAYNRVGNVAEEQGRLDDALAAFRDELAISQRLAATDPSNAGWQRALAVAHNKFGQVLQDIGDQEGAQSNYKSAVVIMERAVALAPETDKWKQDLENLESWLDSEPQ